MKEFIIVTQPLKINLFSIIFINKEMKLLHDKKCNVGIYHNNEFMILVRQLDNSVMFLDEDFEEINYVKQNKKAIKDILENYPVYLNYPTPRINNFIG